MRSGVSSWVAAVVLAAVGAAAGAGCGGGGGSSAPAPATIGGTMPASGGPGAGSGAGAGTGTTTILQNGDATGIAPLFVNGAAASDAFAVRISIDGTGFTAPAFVEVGTGLLIMAVAAESVTPTRVEAVLPPLAAGRYEVRVGQGAPAPIPVAGPAVTLDVTAWPRTTGPGRLKLGRSWPEAVRLHSGEVLIAGGFAMLDLTPAPIEVFDPVTGSCSEVARLRYPRGGHRAILLDSGRVLIAGGFVIPDGNGGWSWQPPQGLPTEVYDPAARSVRELPLSIRAEKFAIVPLGGDLALLAGGKDAAGNPLPNAYVIDGATGAHTAVPAPSSPRLSAAAVRLPTGEVALFGGTDAIGQTQDTAELYDPASRTWRPIPGRLAAPRVGAGAVVTTAASGGGFEVAVFAGNAVMTGRSSTAASAWPIYAPTGPALETWSPAGGFRAEACTVQPTLEENGPIAVLRGRSVVYAAQGTVYANGRPGEAELRPATPHYAGPGVTALDGDRVLVAGGWSNPYGGSNDAADVLSIASATPLSATIGGGTSGTGSGSSGAGSGSGAGAGATSPPPASSNPPRIYDEDIPVAGDTIVYVLDISGSMGWDDRPYVNRFGQSVTGPRIERAKDTIAASIDGLPASLKFNVVAYDCGVSLFRPAAAYATAAERAAAIAWLQAVQPAGATGTGPAVAAALADKTVHTVVLLSDGAPNCGASDIAGHLRMIQQANTQRAAIHCFGIAAYGEFERFMRDIASTSGGAYYAVP